MVENEVVRNKATTIATDASRPAGRDLSDAESECLRDLLASDEAFGALITAQQNAVMVDRDDHDIPPVVEHRAADGAGQLGEAIDRVVDLRIKQAKEIVELADGYDSITWGVAFGLYQAGYKTVEDLQTATRESLVANGNVHPKIADEIKDEVGDLQEAEA